MSERSSRKIPQEILSVSAAVILVYLLLIRVATEFHSYLSETILLRVEAKCPGLPYGSTSGGPDYINIALDIGLLAAAAYLVYITVRDISRKRRRQVRLGAES
ncbi:MAG: hypothetical protein ACRECH_04485 [Nitrososphaerales archaeon]